MFLPKPLVIVLLGPTATGKTELAIEIAKYFNMRIHNIDSRQIYRDMNIGTAKPTIDQQKKIKHFLIDITVPTKRINVRKFQEIATESINKEIKNNELPFLVGGSGLYMNAITSGFFVPEIPPQKSLRDDFEKLGQEKCWELLKICDPKSIEKINSSDQIRTIRALEVFYVTGKPLSEQQFNNPPPWRILELGIDREDIKERILNRTQNMFNLGLVEETQNIINKYGEDLPLLQTIGYEEAKGIVYKKLNINEAVKITSQKTIQFSKRQRTWFRNKNNPLWLNNKNPLKDAIIKIESAML